MLLPLEIIQVACPEPYEVETTECQRLFATEASTQSGTIELLGFIGNIDNYLSWQ